MEKHGEEVERYLAEFQPRPVRALETSPRIERVWHLWLIAAAAILLFIGVSLWKLRQETTGPRSAPAMRQVSTPPTLGRSQLNTVALTKLALEDSEQFEVLLVIRSRTALPSFQGEHSTLRALARE
jgi:hypothetical protein